MSIEIITPSSREEWLAGKLETVGASEGPALLGVHPYLTPFEVFHRKAGRLDVEQAEPRIDETSISLPPLVRGNFLEENATELARWLRPEWTITSNAIPGGNVFIDRSIGMSCTPDAFVAMQDGTKAVLQIKSVEPMTFRNKWKQDGVIEPPLWIALQTLQDATLSGCSRAFVGAMVIGYNVDFHLIEVPLHLAAMQRLREAVKDFWRRIEENDPYPADYARDGAVIASLYRQDDGSEIDLSENAHIASLVNMRDELKALEKAGDEATKKRKVIDSEILHALGNASRGVLPDGRILEAKTIERKEYVAKASTFRTIRVKEAK